MNDDCQIPIDVARAKGYGNVVRAIEGHVCLFSGWLKELYGPGFLELVAPQLLSRKIWAVILPCGSHDSRKPLKLELAIYSSAQDAQPRTIVPLWKANLEEPNFNLPDPTAIVSDISKSRRIKLAPQHENEKQQLQRFCNASKGIPQMIQPLFPFNNQPPTAPPPTAEDEELAMAIKASLQSAAQEMPPHNNYFIVLGSDASTSMTPSTSTSNHKESTTSSNQEAGPGGISSQHLQCQNTIPSVIEIKPSAPPVADSIIDDGQIHYPSIDLGLVDLSSTAVEKISISLNEKKENGSYSSSCTICLDAPLEGACIPCGHMAGCMTCLNEIKGEKWGCPVCRAKIDQVIRIYAV